MSAIVYCVRGCNRKRRHLSECEGGDCQGCEPMRAEYGLLCWNCHRRFQLMLTQAEIAERWLTGNLPAGSDASRAKEDYETRGGDKEAPAPIAIAIYDIRQLLRDRLACWSDDLAEHRELMGPKRHSVAMDAGFLLTWLTTVEHLAWVGDWFEELAETMGEAHCLAPWRPAMTRLPKIECPECHQMQLAMFGGEEDVTCLNCRSMYSSGRFGVWSNMIENDKTA